MTDRPWITCHVLDTVAGRPGADIAVTLKVISPSSSIAPWTGKTNSDGRVTSWIPEQGSTQVNDVVAVVRESHGPEEQVVWSLTFDTESYFGKGKTFWPEVELRFATKQEEQHYHVPLLLGPWSYTTYRGS